MHAYGAESHRDEEQTSDSVAEAQSAGMDVSTLPEPNVSLSDEGKERGRPQNINAFHFASFLLAVRAVAAHLQFIAAGACVFSCLGSVLCEADCRFFFNF